MSQLRHNVSLSPCHIGEPRAGIEQEMTALLMQYSEPVKGVILAFHKVELEKPKGFIINEMPYIHCKVRADALVFRPTPGMRLEGTVNKIGSNHVGMLFAGVFNGSVSAAELPKGYVHNYHEDCWCVGMNGDPLLRLHWEYANTFCIIGLRLTAPRSLSTMLWTSRLSRCTWPAA